MNEPKEEARRMVELIISMTVGVFLIAGCLTMPKELEFLIPKITLALILWLVCERIYDIRK